ncbi:activator of mitotic machinery Cdc14 phosphatase activation C-term-domain-containing protein [Blakeslea trispora]|nr:activator of mitotic machinery Cdc14 phosphatase activation C-term-domain-containing protein [Blakeslea trispora]
MSMFTEKSPDNDMYAALMLSDLLNNEHTLTHSIPPSPPSQSLPPPPPPLPLHDDPLPVDNVIWVPADKHPQIAPNEFANFLKTHGANIPTKRSSSLRRRGSILSQSVSMHDTPPSEKKQAFLKRIQSPSDQPDSPQKKDKSLLRRSALSARGRSRKHKPEEKIHRRASSNQDTSWDTSVGVSLFDQPVNLSEWIDLGTSLESKRGIISRVHDAESQLWSHQTSPKRTFWSSGWFEKKKTMAGLASFLQRSFSTKRENPVKKKRSSRLEPETFFHPYRLPLHVERAIYRLSHMKLADPRRPLRQQVLISNLMFWYLSIQQHDFQPLMLSDPKHRFARIHPSVRRRMEMQAFIQTTPKDPEEDDDDNIPLSHYHT